MITPPKPLIASSSQAVWLDRLRRSAESHRASFGDGVLVSKTSRGVSYRANKRQGGGGSRLMLMQIKGIGDNDLTCCEWDGKTLETLEIKVARPYLSRRYVYALSTSPVYTYVDAQKRTVPNGTQTDTHEITAKYNVGDMILAANVHTFEDSSTDALEWEWLDLNMDGRDWARTQTA